MSDTLANVGILQALTINVGVCDFCAGIHVNLYDGTGKVFATAILPAAIVDEFIDRIQLCKRELASRVPAPARTQ